MKRSRSFGMIILAVWLILVGLRAFVNIGDLGKFLDLLAVAAGVLILLGR